MGISINLVEHLNLLVHLNLLFHLNLLGLLVRLEAGRRLGFRGPRRSTQSGARNHRVLDRSTCC